MLQDKFFLVDPKAEKRKEKQETARLAEAGESKPSPAPGEAQNEKKTVPNSIHLVRRSDYLC
jgi:hypothetical protein